MKIQASAEDYLETILILGKENGRVRAVDIAHHMNFSKPTVSIIMKQFKENGYVEIGADRYIQLTEKGAKIAKRTYERHLLITKVLVAIGVDKETALADACKIEHNLSDTSFECIKNFYEDCLRRGL